MESRKRPRPHADSLSQSIRTQVPFKLGQRHTTSRVDQTVIHTVRIYDRALSPREAGLLAGASRAAALAARRPPTSGRRKSRTRVFAWWRGAIDPASQELRERAGAVSKRKKPQSSSEARSPT